MTKEKKKSNYKPAAPAVEQAAQVLLCLGKNEDLEMGLTAICKEIGIHKSKGFSILNALSRYDLVTKDDATKKYALGPALMPLARKAEEKIDITAIARDPLQQLAAEYNTSVLLGIISNDQFFVSGKYDGNERLSVTVRLHQSLHISHGAHGKAIFAFLKDSDRDRIIASDNLQFYGDPAKFDPDRLQKELDDCRKNGFAVDNGEMTSGITAVSSPVFDRNNDVIGAIVLVGTFKPDKFDMLGKVTAQTAREISRKAGASI